MGSLGTFLPPPGIPRAPLKVPAEICQPAASGEHENLAAIRVRLGAMPDKMSSRIMPG